MNNNPFLQKRPDIECYNKYNKNWKTAMSEYIVDDQIKSDYLLGNLKEENIPAIRDAKKNFMDNHGDKIKELMIERQKCINAMKPKEEEEGGGENEKRTKFAPEKVTNESEKQKDVHPEKVVVNNIFY
jgi:hypothetical protein